MRLIPKPLINTYRLAAFLKLVGLAVGMVSAEILVNDWLLPRWKGALIYSTLLLLWLMPWPRLAPATQQLKWRHRQLKSALFIGLLVPPLELIATVYVPPKPALLTLVGWTEQTANNVHALGMLFLMVPVVLASWQYGHKGMWFSMGVAGLVYAAAPFFMPPNAFIWQFYIVRGFVFLGVTFILAFITAFLAIDQQRKQEALAQANRELANQALLKEALAAGRERTRLARELHDTLAHSLSGTAVQLQAVATLINIDRDEAQQALKTAQQQIKQGLTESRRAIAALRATPLETLGLVEALRQMVSSMGERNGWQTTIQIENDLPVLGEVGSQTVYRVADEALRNIERHAAASNVSLSLIDLGAKLKLVVVDDGVGFTPKFLTSSATNFAKESSAETRFGLIGMAERATLADGALTIHSQPNAGTQIILEIPF